MRILRPEEVTPDTVLNFDPLTPEELAEAYRLAREAFTAADLQKYTELDLDKGPLADDVIAEMEEAQRLADEKTK